MKLQSLNNKKFDSFEQNKITNPMSIFGGIINQTTQSNGKGDSINRDTRGGQGCDGKPCDFTKES